MWSWVRESRRTRSVFSLQAFLGRLRSGERKWRMGRQPIAWRRTGASLAPLNDIAELWTLRLIKIKYFSGFHNVSVDLHYGRCKALFQVKDASFEDPMKMYLGMALNSSLRRVNAGSDTSSTAGKTHKAQWSGDLEETDQKAKGLLKVSRY